MLTKVAECFNNILHNVQLLPIKTCVQFTFNQIVQLFTAKQKIYLQHDIRFPQRNMEGVLEKWTKDKDGLDTNVWL